MSASIRYFLEMYETKVCWDMSHQSWIIHCYSDNQGCINFSNNDQCGGDFKHIDLRYNFERETVRNFPDNFDISFCPTKAMFAAQTPIEFSLKQKVMSVKLSDFSQVPFIQGVYIENGAQHIHQNTFCYTWWFWGDFSSANMLPSSVTPFIPLSSASSRTWLDDLFLAKE
jgi:hypothetical protein